MGARGNRKRQGGELARLFKDERQHAVLPIGGKTRVATWGEDPEFPRSSGHHAVCIVRRLQGAARQVPDQISEQGKEVIVEVAGGAHGGCAIRDGSNTTAACGSCRSETKTVVNDTLELVARLRRQGGRNRRARAGPPDAICF